MIYRASLVVALVVYLVAVTSIAQENTTATNPDAPTPETPAAYTAETILEGLNTVVRETFTGVVTAVDAGDLLSLNRNETSVQVRLYGVDCPETGQNYAEEARAAVVKAVLDTTVSVQILTEDSQGLPVALVFDGTGNCLSHVLAAEGLAWWDDRNAQKDALLRKVNAKAVSAPKGIFADTAALAPWDYRKSNELPDFEYTLEAPKPEPKPAAAPAIEEPRSISAKGTMTENRPRPAAAPGLEPASPGTSPAGGMPLSIPGIPADVVKDVNVGDLLMRHQPRIATDSSGRPLGLTANNVSSIPHASEYGFEEGDIVSRVNGIPIESEAQIMGLIPQFMNVRTFQVDVLRNGKTITKTINVK